MKVVAIMPIKLKNERLPGKNVKLLGDKPLIQYSLQSLNKVRGIDDIIVYCSDTTIKNYLIDGVTFIQRPVYLDEPTSNFTQIFGEFLNVYDADIYIYAHATAPYVEVSTIQKCLDKVVNDGFDSAFCASRIQDYLWMHGEPLNFDATNIPRSQDLEPIYRETSGVYVFKKEVFKKYKRRIGTKPYIAEVSYREAIDINEPEDFEKAEKFL